MQDDVAAERLVEIARTHCKLVLEHGDKKTLPERREAIKAEIERLRVERDDILLQLESNV
jgi:hypothetical protein